jgi:hypothetical protein
MAACVLGCVCAACKSTADAQILAEELAVDLDYIAPKPARPVSYEDHGIGNISAMLPRATL